MNNEEIIIINNIVDELIEDKQIEKDNREAVLNILLDELNEDF